MAKIEGKNGFFAISGHPSLPNAAGIIFRSTGDTTKFPLDLSKISSTITFANTNPETIGVFDRMYRKLLCWRYIRPQATHRLILRRYGHTLFDGLVILKPRKGRVAKIAGRSLNHAEN